MGLGETGGDAQLLQPPWMSPGAEEAQHLQSPLPTRKVPAMAKEVRKRWQSLLELQTPT